MTAVFSRESFDAVIDEAIPLGDQHWLETGAGESPFPLELDVERYRRAEASGVLRIYTVRMGGVLVGYASWILSSSLHHKGILTATNDLFFLLPAARAPRVATRWLDFIEEALTAEGAQAVFINSRVGHPALVKLLSARGYRLLEQTHVRELTPWA